jgi:hypothetical protein
VSLLLQLRQELVQQHQLATVLYEVFSCNVFAVKERLRAVEEIGVIAALAKLHDHCSEVRT